jgi:hypothetical protein
MKPQRGGVMEQSAGGAFGSAQLQGDGDGEGVGEGDGGVAQSRSSIVWQRYFSPLPRRHSIEPNRGRLQKPNSKLQLTLKNLFCALQLRQTLAVTKSMYSQLSPGQQPSTGASRAVVKAKLAGKKFTGKMLAGK